MFRNPTTDLIIALVIVLLIFGPKRLPTLGRQLGHGLREFKDSVTGGSKDDDDGDRPEIGQSSVAPPAAAAPQSSQDEAAPSAAAPERDSAEVGSQERRP